MNIRYRYLAVAILVRLPHAMITIVETVLIQVVQNAQMDRLVQIVGAYF
jgi:hypothetical protein